MMFRSLAPVALILFLAGCTASSDEIAAMRGLDTGSMVSLAEAIQIAKKEVPDGFPIEAELEIEDDDEEEDEPTAYEVVLYVADLDVLMEVEVDAFTGAVLEVEVEDEGDDHDDE